MKEKPRHLPDHGFEALAGNADLGNAGFLRKSERGLKKFLAITGSVGRREMRDCLLWKDWL